MSNRDEVQTRFSVPLSAFGYGDPKRSARLSSRELAALDEGERQPPKQPCVMLRDISFQLTAYAELCTHMISRRRPSLQGLPMMYMPTGSRIVSSYPRGRVIIGYLSEKDESDQATTSCDNYHTKMTYLAADANTMGTFVESARAQIKASKL